MTRVPAILRGGLLVGLMASGASGCQLIADFDRSKIPTDAGQLPDGGSFEAGVDAQLLDGSFDAMLPPFDAGDAGDAAAQDAGHDAGTVDDAGTDDDAGSDDAG